MATQVAELVARLRADSTGMVTGLSSSTMMSNALSTGRHLLTIEGTIETTTGGTIGMQWAQLVSGGNITRMSEGSVLKVNKVLTTSGG